MIYRDALAAVHLDWIPGTAALLLTLLRLFYVAL